MKNIVLILTTFISITSYSQWQLQGTQYGETTPQMIGIHVGNVTADSDIAARLHVNNFRCNSPAGGLNGRLLRTDGDQNRVAMWQLFTGTSANAQFERFRLYSEPLPSPYIGLQSLSNGLRFETAGAFPRFRINGNSTANINGFVINNTGFMTMVADQVFWTDPLSEKQPFSLLHLAGSGANYAESGFRPWMRDGITFTSNGDLSYIGPRSLGQVDRNEFVIQWSDNANPDLFGPDDLVFRFTRANGSDPVGMNSLEGLEVMRCTGEQGIGRVGIGDEFSDLVGFRPQRRLHVHDEGVNNEANAQLRLSQNFSSTFTDFRTTAQGNLYLNMTGEEQRVGVEEPNPLERLDVAGNGRFQGIPVIQPNCVILGQNINNSSDNRLTRLDLNGNPGTYLAGDGTWQNAAGGLCDWDLIGAQDLATGYPGACRPGNVAIGDGVPLGDTKLAVTHILSAPALFGQRINAQGGTAVNMGLLSESTGGPNSFSIGVYGLASGSTDKNIGGYFKGELDSLVNATEAIGCVGTADTPSCIGTNTGLVGLGTGSKFLTEVRGGVNGVECTDSMTGVQGEATGTAGTFAYGGYFSTSGAQSPSTYAVFANGPAGGITNWNASDENLKQEIQPIEGALDVVMSLQPSTYYFRSEEFPQLDLPSDQHCGLLASNIQEVLPSLVKEAYIPARRDTAGNVITNDLNFRMVNYTELIPFLIKSVQEQQQQIAQLTAMVNECCGFTAAARSASDTEESLAQSDVTLSNEGNIVLNQNVPNPFAERTSIDYEINQPFQKAQILFHDQSGKLIQVADIFQQGKGRLNVFADDLSTGTYTYSLVVDGAIISSHKMVKQ
jgi:hypothetical protein